MTVCVSASETVNRGGATVASHSFLYSPGQCSCFLSITVHVQSMFLCLFSDVQLVPLFLLLNEQ